MTYVMSDLHGMVDKYVEMLDKIGGLRDGDTLYVLGDVIDRGPDGDVILLSMMSDLRIVPIMGNHEYYALPILKAIKGGMPMEWVEKSPQYKVWTEDGGDLTAKAFVSHSRETQNEIYEYVKSFSIYKEITVCGRRFHLSHTLPEYDPARNADDVPLKEFVWGEPNYDKCYDPGVTFITGHTPTKLIDPAYEGRIWQGNGHIAIDCGAAFGGRLGCLCLDTMEEYYV